MQQRAAIARVLAGEPSIVLMDEPLGALDAITRERMQSELVAIWLRTARTFVLITHSVDEALLLGTRVLVLGGRPGRIVLDLDIGSDEPGAVRRSSTAYPALRDRVVRAIAEVVVET
jgi:ABC-type nitrate/sulfonate/bicarbonate transport system ATPase subunit